MKFIKWSLLLIPLTILLIINYIFGPIIVLFASKEGWLPKWLWWFQTIDGSLDGFKKWQEMHPNKYIRRLLWIYRNPVYGFAYNIMGAKNVGKMTITGNQDITDTGNGGYGSLYISTKKYFCFYYIGHSLFNKKIRIYLGWKLKKGAKGPPYQYVCSINLFKK